MTLAKALAGGLPMGAMLAGESVSEKFERGDHASTFGGGPLVSAAALASIKVIAEEGLVERSADLGAYLRQELQRLDLVEVRGLGLMVGLDLAENAGEVVSSARERGLLLNNTGEHTLRLVPSLVVSKEEIDLMVIILEEILG
jgi:acetylornithine/N-succinyldiaminopimelate aminotransferase